MTETPTAFQIQKRPLPSFKKWLEDKGERASGYEAFVDLVERTQSIPLDNLLPHQKSFGRIFMGASIAAVELCQIEEKQHKRPQDEVVANLARAFATATMYAIASVTEPDTPYRSIAKVLTEEFKAAAKVAADTLIEQYERDQTTAQR